MSTDSDDGLVSLQQIDMFEKCMIAWGWGLQIIGVNRIIEAARLAHDYRRRIDELEAELGKEKKDV